MSVRRLAPDHIQPKEFAFDAANQNWVKTQVSKYPEGRQASAVIPLLWQAQKQAGGWLPKAAIEHVAQVLEMPNIRVLEVATFYTMFNLAPVGQHFVQFCGTTPCVLRGANGIKKVCEEKIGPEKTVTADGKFSWLEVECLGACSNAPMVQINDDFYEDLTPENFTELLDDLAAGRDVKKGSQIGRNRSEPEGDIKTLLDPALYDGSAVGSWKKAFDERLAAAAAAKAAAAAAQPAAAPAAPKPATPPAAPVAPPAAAAQQAVAAAVPSRPAPTNSPTNVAKDTPVDEGARAKEAATPAHVTQAQDEAKVSDEFKPELLTAARDGKGDDLELIWGVGPKLAEMLHKMGVYHFDQIAAWTDMNLRWVDQNLGAFKGRAVRDKWIDQAKKLATGWRPDKSSGGKHND
ncbi:NADH-quinone oxidoreductase subunit NuoE [Terrarubrum flagellatum]|uniref:NADH-quinone oxidoreductase subunit NuoE n=1 Tax=Terrirubrum flagellatum TaxID=2895980 RepID=UPI003145079A